MQLRVRVVGEGSEEYRKELLMLQDRKWWMEFEQELPEWAFLKGEKRQKQAELVRIRNKIRTLENKMYK